MRLMELLFEFLTKEAGHEPDKAAQALWRDYQRGGRHDKPAFLKEFLFSGVVEQRRESQRRPTGQKRQARHGASVS
jgi:hypothetical protein